jgi:WD40 repeat protein
MAGYPAKAREFAWHKGGRWFATNGVFDCVLVWDCAGRGPEGRQPAMLKWHTGNVSALQYQPGGDLLASGDKDGGVSIWNPALRNPQIAGAKIPSGVSCLAWSPDQEFLAINGEEGDVQVISLDE